MSNLIKNDTTINQFPLTADLTADKAYNIYKRQSGAHTYNCYTEADITAAITAIGTGYGTIRIHGTIELTASITLNGNGDIIIEGINDGSVIDCGGDRSALIISSASKTKLKDFKIDAADLTNTATKVIDHTSGILIMDNMNILGDTTNGYALYTTGSNGKFTNCTFGACAVGVNQETGTRNIYIGNDFFNNASTGFYAVSNSYLVVSNNTFYSNGRSNALNAGLRIDTGTAVIMNNNLFYTNAGFGILSYTIKSSIVGNVIYGCDTNSESDFAGIKQISGDRTVIVGNNVNDCNNSGGGTGYGIYIDNTCDETTIVGNTCLGNDTNISDNGTNSNNANNNTA